MVIMDRQDYISKANTLLNQNTYRSIPWDPTNTIKNKLIKVLKRVKSQTGLRNKTYKSMYPTACVPPKFYGLPKIHKPDTPLRPILSSWWVGHIWCGQGTCQNLKTPSWQVPPPHQQYPRLCGTGQTHHSGTRRMPQLL